MTALAHTAAGQNSATDSFMDGLFKDFNQPNTPGASVMVIHDGKPVFARGYGLAEIEAQTPCRTNTNFRLASVSKQFTAMAVLILVDRKKLSLDENLSDFFPEFPDYGKKITVRQLLTHTSGLIDYEDIIPKGTEIPVLDRDVLRLLMQENKTYFPPGSKYRYSNSAFSLLSLIVEARSGNPFAQFLAQNIFGPLKMDHTLAYEQGWAVITNRAYGYTREGETWKRTDQSLTSSVLGDGGIYSSVADLSKWAAALYRNPLISPQLQEQAFTPAVETDRDKAGYGFGWFIGSYRGTKEIWHSGESRGFTTRITRFPEKKFTVIILTNRNGGQISEFPHKIADEFLFSAK